MSQAQADRRGEGADRRIRRHFTHIVELVLWQESMGSVVESRCTILINTDLATAGQQDELIRDLEHHPHVSMKIRAIKQAITLLLSGEVMPR